MLHAARYGRRPLVPVTIPANSPAAPSSFADGLANAPTGTPQFPTILSGYTKRPPWNVAGVDYYVGVPSNAVLRVPTAGNLPAGASISGSMITVSGNNVTLDSYDLTQGGGVGISVNSGVTKLVIQNCSFLTGTNAHMQIFSDSADITIQNCTCDGNKTPDGTGFHTMISITGTGNPVVEYCWFKNSAADVVDLTNVIGTPTIRYNLFNNNGFTVGDHPDDVQLSGGTITGMLSQFNTHYNQQAGETAGIDPLRFANSGTITNCIGSNWTIISTGPTQTDAFLIDVVGASESGTIIKNNYVDPTGAFGVYLTPITDTSCTFAGDFNMNTGAKVASPAGATWTSDVHSAASSPASGSVNVGGTVTITLTMSMVHTVTGVPSLSLNTGGSAVFSSGSGSGSLVFTYTVGAGDSATSNLAVTGTVLNGGSITDAVGNPANMDGANVTFTGLAIV